MIRKLINKTFNVFGFAIVRLRNSKFFPYFIDKEIEGVKFKFFIGDTDGRAWYHIGARDPIWLEMRFIKEMIIQEGDIVIECGSHHGCTTILLSEWVGKKGKVIAFEPNPGNFEIAKINLAINSIENVELINNAVAMNAGEVQIDVSSSNSSIQPNTSTNNNSYTIKSINLDSLEGITPNVLKIDVEGYEKDVLAGAKRIIKNKPKLVIEVHTEQLKKYNTSVTELFDIINPDNYDFWIQWEDNELPKPYKFEKQINKRVHLFGLPKTK